jgi:hypothetical protein
MLGRGVKGFKHNNNLFDPAQYGHIAMSATLTFPLQVATFVEKPLFYVFLPIFCRFPVCIDTCEETAKCHSNPGGSTFFFFSSFLKKNDTGPLLLKKTRYLKGKLYFNLHSLGNF